MASQMVPAAVILSGATGLFTGKSEIREAAYRRGITTHGGPSNGLSELELRDFKRYSKFYGGTDGETKG